MPATKPLSYSHVGGKPHCGYRHLGVDANHHSPQPGKKHALNKGESGDIFISICGELIPGHYDDAENFSDEVGLGRFCTVEPASDAVGTGVTCGRCRKILQIRKWCVQAFNPYSRKWYTIKDGGNYDTEEAAIAFMRYRECVMRGVQRRVKLI